MKTNHFKSLNPNYHGTDFFVGDIHGNFVGLSESLSNVGFDPDKDRLFSTGDLIDRGQDSEIASYWLEKDFFEAVAGNHERFYLHWRYLAWNRSEQKEFEETFYFKNGGRWVKETSEDEHKRLTSLIEKMPYFITVPHTDGRIIGLVHAEIPDGATWPSLLVQDIDEDMIYSLTSGRSRITHERQKQRKFRLREKERLIPEPEDKNIIKGLDAVVCGHSTVSEVYKLGNINYIDTGGWIKRNIPSDNKFSIIRIQDILDSKGGF